MKEKIKLDDTLFTPNEASKEIKVNNGHSDGLKKSRSTGQLWGYPAPRFIKAKRKVLYRKSDLDAFIAQLPQYQNNAEAMEAA